MSGWIKINRSINNHWIFKDPIKFKWWIDILLMANYEAKRVSIGYKVFECKRGECLMSLKSWGERWGVSKTVVNNFFSMLESDNMIKTVNETVTTRLLVCNYDSYQQIENGNKTETKRNQNATEPQQSTTKESKESKESKEINNKYKKLLLSEIVISDFPHINIKYFESAKYWQKLFKQNLIDSDIPTTLIDEAKGKWIDDIRMLIEKDGYTFENFREVYEFLKINTFWKKNILSTSKLREQMPKLMLEIRNPINKKLPNTPKPKTPYEIEYNELNKGNDPIIFTN